VKPNNRLHLTAKPLRGLVPSGLRPPAAGEPKRWATMTWKSIVSLLGVLTALFGCGGAQPPEKVGGLYSVDDGEGWFRVAKVLVVENEGVHIRLYKNKFKARPRSIEFSSLSLRTVHDADGFGMGHLPLTHRAFRAWQPVFLAENLVADGELDGYRAWRDAKGGFFGDK